VKETEDRLSIAMADDAKVAKQPNYYERHSPSQNIMMAIELSLLTGGQIYNST
jgi:hypothetical protein